MQEPLTPEEKMEVFRQSSLDVLVDFDGTICEFKYPDMGPPLAGAKEMLYWIRRKGLRVVIWTSRMSPAIYTVEEREASLEKIMAYMAQWKLPYDEIDDGCSGKRLALAYIDDRAIAVPQGLNSNAMLYARIEVEYLRKAQEARLGVATQPAAGKPNRASQ